MIKALAEAAGAGLRPVQRRLSWRRLTMRATSEAQKAFGSGDLYLKRCFIQQNTLRFRSSATARGWSTYGIEIEVYSVNGRNWSRLLLRLGYPSRLGNTMLESAQRIALAANYEGVGTIEFLVGADDQGIDRFVFMGNEREIKKRHTVTEEVTGLDLVALQLRLVGVGKS